jgi:lactate dehydrogenase-like 2-hydroxyacid dehydrogenase
LGYGRVGKKVAKYAEAFDLRICVSDPYIDLIGLDENPKYAQVDRDTLLATSDVIVICASVVNSSKIIGQRELLLIKESAILVNSARGNLWDEHAIANALTQGKISGVGVDVYQFEEVGEEQFGIPSPLLHLDPSKFNIIRTAHVGGACKDSIDQVVELSLEQIRAEFPRE